MATSTINQIMNNEGTGYCKMPGGTLICWGRGSVERNAGNNTVAVNFAHEFYDINNLEVMVSTPTSNPAQFRAYLASATKSSVTLGLYNSGAAVSTGTSVRYIAIGRWKA